MLFTARSFFWYQTQSDSATNSRDMSNLPEQCKYVCADFVLFVLSRKYEMAKIKKLAKFQAYYDVHI